MTKLYQKCKKGIYNWREKNVDKYKEQNRKDNRRHYNWKKIKQEFLNILIDI